MIALRRGVWLLTAIAIMGLVLPLRAERTQLRANKTGCCAHMQAHRGHCESEPAKPADSQEEQCCAACGSGLSLINGAVSAYIFTRSEGKMLAIVDVNQTSRSARPPVPPPRA
jgi:hypothetical protein